MPNTSINLKHNKYIAIWLFACAALLFAMVIIGGLTRLTESGLSMVEWKPLTGILPPLNLTEWQAEFAKYMQTPQYQKVFAGMGLSEFKQIYWFEYIHRIMGRLLGLAFIVPFLFFLSLNMLRDKKLTLRLIGIFLLGGLQGFAGWYMVKSGLVNDPYISQYRLVLHLTLAFVIYALLFLQALDLWQKSKSSYYKNRLGKQKMSKLKLQKSVKQNVSSALLQNLIYISYLITVFIFLQVMIGGFMAGTDAGLLYNTFPLMNGAFIPEDILFREPWWLNFTENLGMIQFNHRLGAYALLALITGFFIYSRNRNLPNNITIAIILLFITIIIQFTVGILTLLHQVPISLASLHQALAMILLSFSLYINYHLSRV